MNTRIPLLTLSVLALCQFLPALQTSKPKVLTDINRTSRYVQHSSPKGKLAQPDASWQTKRFQKVGTHVFFQAQTKATGAELYYCTSQQGSAGLAVDILKGTGSSHPTEFMELGGKLYFKATDGSNYQVYEATPGTKSVTARKLTAFTNTSAPGAIGTLIAAGQSLYFTGQDAVTSQYHIHRVDLTTYKSFRYATALKWHWVSPVELGQRIVFEGHDSQGQEAWWLDGDKIGYIRNYSGSAHGRCVDPIELSGFVYFCAFDGKWGIWKWGPKLGTKKVMDLTLKYGWSHPVVLGKRLIFNGGTGEPFSVDPAAAAPKVLSLPSSSSEGGMTTPIVLRNKLYYYGYSSKQSYAGYYLFETDGLTSRSIDGTRAYQGGPSAWIAPVVIPATKPYLLFGFKSGTPGDSLYKFDGTSFQRLLQIHYSLYRNSGISMLTELGGKVFFGASDGRYGAEIWSSDGTGAGTALHTNLAVETRTSGSNPLNFVRLGRKLYFTAHDGEHGFELWSTDGKPDQEGPNSTAMVVDLNPGTGSSDPKDLIACEGLGAIFFSAYDGKSRDAYVFDQNSGKTKRIAGNIKPDLWSAWGPSREEYIVAMAQAAKGLGLEPHVYDALSNSFKLLVDTNPGAGNGDFQFPANALWGDYQFTFRSQGKLFASGGTSSTTKEIKLPSVGWIGENIAVNGKSHFSGTDSQNMPVAYAVDTKTNKVQKFQSTTNKNGTVFGSPFVANAKIRYLVDNGYLFDLYEWDGNSTSGKKISTTPIAGLHKFHDTSEQADVVSVSLGIGGDKLIFPAMSAGGLQAWKVDAKGLSRIGTQSFSWVSSAISLGGNRVAFVARTAASGYEVHVTDGVKISMVSDSLAPGFASGANRFSDLWAMADALIFSGNDALGVGAELFAWPTNALAQAYGAGGARGYDFRASDPIMGKNMVLQTTADSRAAAVIYTLSTPAQNPLNLAGSRFYLDLRNMMMLVSVINQGFNQIQIPIPNQGRFLGMQVEGQAIVVDLKFAIHLTQAASLSLGK